jgi:hypothetical protein
MVTEQTEKRQFFGKQFFSSGPFAAFWLLQAQFIFLLTETPNQQVGSTSGAWSIKCGLVYLHAILGVSRDSCSLDAVALAMVERCQKRKKSFLRNSQSQESWKNNLAVPVIASP